MFQKDRSPKKILSPKFDILEYDKGEFNHNPKYEVKV